MFFIAPHRIRIHMESKIFSVKNNEQCMSHFQKGDKQLFFQQIKPQTKTKKQQRRR